MTELTIRLDTIDKVKHFSHLMLLCPCEADLLAERYVINAKSIMNYDDPVQGLSIHFTKGTHHLSGQEALEVVRFRHNNDGSGYGTEDIGRIGTQQAFLTAVAKKALSPANLSKVSSYAKIFHKYVDTDLSLGNLAWLGTQAIQMGTDNIHFSTLPGDGSGYYKKISYYTLDPSGVLEMVNATVNPYTTPRTAADLDILVP